MTSVYSNESNQSVISALLVHRIDSGVLLSAGDLRRLQAARNASEGPAAASKANLLHPAPIIGSNPPPGCPMHASSPSSSSPSSSSRTPASTGSSQLKRALPTSFAALSSKASGSMSSASGDACPVPHDQRDAYMASQGQNKKIAEQLNPLNNMPELAQSAMSSKQHSLLSTERTLSSIPRSVVSPSPGASPYDAPTPPGACPVAHDVKGKGKEEAVHGQVSHWEYPSPQQFYNALVRKGWETPEEHVDMMVLIHNFLNERAWQEVIEWERLAGT
ncbi:hypothetical protein K437DRAFT_258768 [Tilletiaria anomala UBC 951]|uniref:Holocytochrome c-type synthase n=1 Tax=Tilletiaria anomala (strain ATCC 24038 / CBS 436.72 / UBC 951) TaxID=1037660 RepID=A0A066VIE8_TILAU|nr:uncharacterized protein K437DRAFT_258768 [Tilletiaria anomala UBC 951]KDN40088.1 hypothetical protein K437DRAFT_258768 [Tilletiaria anomala UBC 951]